MTYFRDEIGGFVTMAGNGPVRHACPSTKCVGTEATLASEEGGGCSPKYVHTYVSVS